MDRYNILLRQLIEMKPNAAEIYHSSVFVIVATAEGYKALLRCNVRVEMMSV